MNLYLYLRFLRANWKRIAVSTLIGIIVAMVYSLTITPKFVATSQIFLSTPRFTNVPTLNSSPYAADEYAQQRARSYVQLVSRKEVAERVIAKLGVDMRPETLVAATTASVQPDTVLIDISVKATSALEAKALADATTAELVSDIRTLESRSGLGVSVVEPVVTEPAAAPKAPSEPNIPIYLLLGAAGGFLIGITAVAWLTQRRLDSRQVEQLTGRPVLGTTSSDIADSQSIVEGGPSTSDRSILQWADIQRRTDIELRRSSGRSSGGVLVVTAEDGSARSSASAAELARAFARTGSRVALVIMQSNANEDHTAGGTGAIGLAEVIAGESRLQDAIVYADDKNLCYLAGPPPGIAAPLQRSEKFREVVGQMRDAFDLIIFDTPDFLEQAESTLLPEVADAVIFVMIEKDVNRRDLLEALRLISDREVLLLGSILNSDPPEYSRRGNRRTFVTSNGGVDR